MNITIFAISKEKVNFFIRVANGFDKKNKITFITTRYSSYKLLKQSNFNVYILQDLIEKNNDIEQYEYLFSDAVKMDVVIDILTQDDAKKQFDYIVNGFDSYFSSNQVDKFILWNGSMMQGFIASHIADLYNVNKLYFEVGNFPNKLFIDNEGVNAKSSLMHKDLSICDNFDKNKLDLFLVEHKKVKEDMHIVPQAKKKAPNYDIVVDMLYNIFSKYPITEYKNIFYKLKDKYSKKIDIIYDKNIDINNINYIFLPLQVSTDSQIIRNSETNLINAIKYAISEAKKNNLALIIKPHPSENNEEINNLIYSEKKKFSNLFLVNVNTYQLIKYSQKVITINSTVGIESLMYYKHTEILGNAFYKKYCTPNICDKIDHHITDRFLFNYLFNVLEDGCFFDNSSTININHS